MNRLLLLSFFVVMSFFTTQGQSLLEVKQEIPSQASIGIEQNFYGIAIGQFNNHNLIIKHSLFPTGLKEQHLVGKYLLNLIEDNTIRGFAGAETGFTYLDGFTYLAIMGNIEAHDLAFISISGQIIGIYENDFSLKVKLGIYADMNKEVQAFVEYGPPIYLIQEEEVVQVGARFDLSALAVKAALQFPSDFTLDRGRVSLSFIYSFLSDN